MIQEDKSSCYTGALSLSILLILEMCKCEWSKLLEMLELLYKSLKSFEQNYLKSDAIFLIRSMKKFNINIKYFG